MNQLMAEAKQSIVNFSSPESSAISVTFWVIVAFVLSSLICVFAIKDDKQKLIARKVLIIVATVLTLGVIATFLGLKGVDAKEDGMKPILYAPFIVFAVVLIATVIVNLFKPTKIAKIATGVLLGLSIIAVIICMSVYYATGDALEFNWLTKADVNSLGLWLGSAGLILLIALVAIFTDKEKSLHFDVKSLAYAGVLGGLSLALSFVKVFKMPMGGSITLASVLPIMIYAYVFGSKKGVILGAILGILNAIQDPWILHPAQFLLDYPIAFASFGLAGCLAKVDKIKQYSVKFLIGGIIGGCLRFMSHFFAGVFAFGSYATENFSNAYAYSAAYQATYVFPDTAIAVVLGFLLMLSRSFTKMMLNVNPKSEKKIQKVEE